ncbi:hypothetical protein [Pseudogemmobacter bohemicus]|uniref:hypothetical protein n=1 Tax=Pseudogemmobacter bohemicus TaxID=2250708 RepID=UPI000DD42256|nr:hypothetical protein [Pseudogemmobacter bohemicus]
MLLADTRCNGDAIKGYTGCIFSEIAVAQRALPLSLLTPAVFAIWFVVVVAIPARGEIQTLPRRRKAG